MLTIFTKWHDPRDISSCTKSVRLSCWISCKTGGFITFVTRNTLTYVVWKVIFIKPDWCLHALFNAECACQNRALTFVYIDQTSTDRRYFFHSDCLQKFHEVFECSTCLYWWAIKWSIVCNSILDAIVIWLFYVSALLIFCTQLDWNIISYAIIRTKKRCCIKNKYGVDQQNTSWRLIIPLFKQVTSPVLEY